jgi:hypothetical protein
VELRFLSPELRKLDQSQSELLVLQVTEDERPPRGCLGLVDYRLGGRISSIISEGRVRGNVGERFLFPGKPKLPFDKILLLGVGSQREFSLARYDELLLLLLEQVAELGVRRAVVELPGRPENWIDPRDAYELLLERSQNYAELDVWTLLDSGGLAKAAQDSGRRQQRRDWGV